MMIQTAPISMKFNKSSFEMQLVCHKFSTSFQLNIADPAAARLIFVTVSCIHCGKCIMAVTDMHSDWIGCANASSGQVIHGTATRDCIFLNWSFSYVLLSGFP